MLNVRIRLKRYLLRRTLCDPAHEFEEFLVGELPLHRKLFLGGFELPDAFFMVSGAKKRHLQLPVLVHNMLWCQGQRTLPLAP